MSDLEEHEFDDEPPTTVMQDELLADLTARSRADGAASFSDIPTAVATVSAAEIFAAAGLGVADAPSPSAPLRGQRRAWRYGALVLIAAALVALLAVLAVHHRLPG